MSDRRYDGWIWLTVGLLYLGLTGLCTLNIFLGDQIYGLWVFGLLVMAPGLAPLWYGWRIIRKPRG